MGSYNMTAEQLISSLQDQIFKLQEELTEANVHIMDFEKAAIEWKKGYTDMEKSYRIRLEHLMQTVCELENELKERTIKEIT